ncbi:MAG: hypothetical protein NXI16_04475 [Alphaproteobacteria bacterium]|nr:hypothetical protein [Alphaproteobacteria bacterium]
MAIKQVTSVKSVGIGELRTFPPIPFVEAVGEVPTSGWTNAMLVPRVYVDPPADGIQDFDFVAEEPTGDVAQIVSEIPAQPFFFYDMPDWVVGVRVHGANNAVEEFFPIGGEPIIQADFVEGQELVAFEADAKNALWRDEIADEVSMVVMASEQCHRMTLAKIKGWPEVKTEMERQCRRVFGQRICLDVPVLYRRNCEQIIEAEICWPTNVDIVDMVEDCVKQALAAGILAGILTGNLAVAASTLTLYLETCLKAKGVEVASAVRVGLKRRKRCGPWRRV